MTYTRKWNNRDKCYDIMPTGTSRCVGQEVTSREADRRIRELNLKERAQDGFAVVLAPETQLVREAIKIAGTQVSLAKAMGVSLSTINQWYSGYMKPSKAYQKAIQKFILRRSRPEQLVKVMEAVGFVD